MAKILRCRDVGFDCEVEVKAETEAEILEIAAKHAVQDHGLPEVTDEVVAKVRAAIRTTAG
jgi:predicted small metal-binding protein